MASHWFRSSLLTWGLLLLVAGGNGLPAAAVRPQATYPAAATAPASPQKIVQYMRDRFGVPESVRLTAEPLRNSQFPIFYQTVVTWDNGNQKLADNIFITKDGRCFVRGTVFATRQGSTDEIMRCVRKVTKLPPQTTLTVGSFTKTQYPEFLKSGITANDGKKTQTAEIFITRDRRTGVLGTILPFKEEFVRSMIKTKDEPSLGPSAAPVTIVEYADLQCPTCARLHEFLQKELMPQYAGKVRLVFKEFPLPFHDWSTTAAIANECVYQINPSNFPQYRGLVFANQNLLTASNVHDQLLSLGEQVGIDRSRLGACIDSKASLWRVDAGRREGENLGIDRTPTSFVNGRIVIGMPPAFSKIIDEALLAAKSGRTSARSSAR